MKALYYNPTIPRALLAKIASLFSRDAFWMRGSPLIYGDVPVPELPGPEWVLLKTRLAGICGSDMGAILLKGSIDNPVRQFTSFPMFMGHEIVGEVAHTGDAVKDWQPGQRAAIYPILSCTPRGISPSCQWCQKGSFNLCQNLAEGPLPPGQCIGLNNRTGGGFSEYFVAHHSQLFRIPDSIPDEHAVLMDPLCVALHAVLQAGLKASDSVLVIGAGIIGLSVIQMIRALDLPCNVYAVARHDFQKELALKSGANETVADLEDPSVRAGLAVSLKAKEYGSRFIRPFFMGGFDVTFDCVGSAETMERALRLSNHRGRILLVGASPSKRFEWSLLYWKEIRLIGSISFGMEWIGEDSRHAIDIVMDMMQEKRLKLDLLKVKSFQLSRYKIAFRSLREKGRSRMVKAAFDFRS